MSQGGSPILKNYYGGGWHPSSGELLGVKNPATQELLARVPLSRRGEVGEVVEHAQRAARAFREVPVTDRVQYLFKFKRLLEENLEELAKTIVLECGKTFPEALGELRRGIENVEVACGAPMLMQGVNVENVAAGIDEFVLRQPLGVVAAITPFNFPGMIPLWFLPYAVACGNAFILKPSERVPITAARLFELLEEVELPPSIVNLVHGGKEVVDSLLQHPQVRAISFVGSKPVASYVYSEGARWGKRVQCQAGAKNHVVVLPDADLSQTTRVVADSAFGCAGQRCLAISVAVTVGEVHRPFLQALSQRAAALRVGFGLEEGVEMGPLITEESRQRVERLIAQGEQEGAKVLVDGRGGAPRYPQGNFVKPTILEGGSPFGGLSKIEIFGPVLSVVRAQSVDEAIEWIAANPYGNAASIFTSSGEAARKFRHEVPCGNIGVNIGVPAPMAFFPFSGWKESFFGVLHGQGRDAVEFYTQKKVVVERWPREWSRKF